MFASNYLHHYSSRLDMKHSCRKYFFTFFHFHLLIHLVPFFHFIHQITNTQDFGMFIAQKKWQGIRNKNYLFIFTLWISFHFSPSFHFFLAIIKCLVTTSKHQVRKNESRKKKSKVLLSKDYSSNQVLSLFFLWFVIPCS